MSAFVTYAGRRILAALLFAFATAAALAQGVVLGPGLDAALGAVLPDQTLTVVVTFEGDGPVDAARVEAVRGLGVTKGLVFHALPVMGVVATPAQVLDIARLPGVRSIWPNAPLTYFNKDARELTGVERLRTDPAMRNAAGLPFSGRGVAVVVNDSGVDGTLPDLRFGENLVENVLGATNLNAIDTLLPVTYTEGLVNTDLGSGHGTHCAGTVGGTGASSDGVHAGVAPGADLIGYGSGAVLFVLDGLGGFDYALTHQFDSDHAPIRVITNSWGSSGAFDPNDPINVASYLAYQRGITVVFAAGNAGPGEDTHNPYAQAPWVISVGAGRKDATLEDFSSRGLKGDGGTFTSPVDGTEWTYANEPTIIAPGVDIVSARATTGALPLLAAEADVAALGANAAFYTIMSGTSMATPHVAGIVALMLEANPALQPQEVRDILRATATNVPGRETWEVGAGYVNAYAAVTYALGRRTDFGATVNALRTFNSNAVVVEAGSQAFTIDYNPVTAFDDHTFDVPAGLAQIKATATVQSVAGVALNTVALVLVGPNGEQAGSGLTLPLLGGDQATVSFDNPAPGTWRLTARGIGSVSGVAVDPLGLTSGVALPETISGTLRFFSSGGYTGLSDVADAHPAAASIRLAVSERLVDGEADGTFRPDAPLTRADLARFLVMGGGIRQHLPASGATFTDVSAADAPFVEAIAVKGAALKDRAQVLDGIRRSTGNAFSPTTAVTRAQLAYALVQSLGLQAFAQGFTGTVTAPYEAGAVEVTDAGQIPAGMKGYVYAALHLGLMHARFEVTQGPFDLKPKVTAKFLPAQAVTRAEYAVSANRYLDAWNAGTATVPTSGGEPAARVAGATTVLPAAHAARDDDAAGVPAAFALSQNYPNPFNPSTTIAFALPEAGRVTLAVYDLLGRQVRVLVEGELGAGAHRVPFDAGDLASGTYLYRLTTPAQTLTRQMTLAK